MFIYEMESPFLRSGTFPLACFNKATVLQSSMVVSPGTGKLLGICREIGSTHCLLPTLPSGRCQRVMVLFNMEIQEVARREILAAL